MRAVITAFAYSDLPAPIAAEVRDATARIKDRLIKDIIETGRDLLEVKSKLQHGQFEPWLSTEFNMTTRTAQKYMRAAEYFADKSELGSHLTPSTIYLLSAPSTPQAIQEKVVENYSSAYHAIHLLHDSDNVLLHEESTHTLIWFLNPLKNFIGRWRLLLTLNLNKL